MSLEGEDFSRTVSVGISKLTISALECYNSKEYQKGWALAKDTTTIRNLQIIEGF